MAEIPAAAAATPVAIPGVQPQASARLLALLNAEPAVQEVWLYGSRAWAAIAPVPTSISPWWRRA